MQGTVKNTQGLLKEIKSHFDGSNFRSKLKDIFPEFCTEKKLGTLNAFTVPARQKTYLKEETVTVASPKSIKAGQHYDAGFFDDLIHEQNFRNAELVEKAIEDFSLYVPLIDPGGYRYVTGTRYTFGDLYEHIQRLNTESHSWQISIKGCWEINEDGSKTLLFPQVKLPDGSKTVGHTLEMLESIQAEDPEMFAAQYLNQPIATDSQLFTEHLLMSHVRSPQEPNFPQLGQRTFFIDLSTSGKNDDCVLLVGQQDPEAKMYVTDAIGGAWQPAAFKDIILTKVLELRPIRVLIEKTAAGNVFAEYLRAEGLHLGLHIPIEFIKVSNQKDAKYLRISIASGVLKKDRLFFFPGLSCWTNMFEQMTTYPRTKHDDYPDTVALMVQHYSENCSTVPVPRSLAAFLAHHELPSIYATEPQRDTHDMGDFL